MGPVRPSRACCNDPGSSKPGGTSTTSSSEALSQAARNVVQYLNPQQAWPSRPHSTQTIATAASVPFSVREPAHLASTCAIVSVPSPPASDPRPPDPAIEVLHSAGPRSSPEAAESFEPFSTLPKEPVPKSDGAALSFFADASIDLELAVLLEEASGSGPRAPHSHRVKPAVDNYLSRAGKLRAPPPEPQRPVARGCDTPTGWSDKGPA
mmetsp:Transcript_5107/g.11305  ORF Transcript_5107/g.11305 Transcript_5107/m.11305 type:complete len:209 (+) Transcript_5107:378-1004(+)